MKITDEILYAGIDVPGTGLSEGQNSAADGMSFNSYVIMDEKIAVMDTVETGAARTWLKNLETVLGERTPDYLVIHHMEPEHAQSVRLFMEKYPDALILSSARSCAMMKDSLGADFQGRGTSIAEGNVLLLGRHRLLFLGTAVTDGPEMLVSYEPGDRVLFSADAFGKFGTSDTESEWDSEAERYFNEAAGKYGDQIKTLLGKISVLDIGTICPLHGPVLSEDIGHYLDLYEIWAS